MPMLCHFPSIGLIIYHQISHASVVTQFMCVSRGIQPSLMSETQLYLSGEAYVRTLCELCLLVCSLQLYRYLHLASTPGTQALHALHHEALHNMYNSKYTFLLILQLH